MKRYFAPLSCLSLLFVFVFSGCDTPTNETGIPSLKKVAISNSSANRDNGIEQDTFTVDDIVYFAFSATDSDLDIVQVVLLQKSDTQTIGPTTMDLPAQYLESQAYVGTMNATYAGNWTIQVYLVDAKGNVSNMVTRNIIVNNPEPKYLYPVDPEGISTLLNTTMYITLPDQSNFNYFRYFTIYYRIYISDLSVSGMVDTGILAQINPVLYADYNYFYSYTNTTSTVAPTTMGTIFSDRKYFPLELENYSIESALGSGGEVITLDFAANAQFMPALIMGDIRYEQPGSPYTRRQLSRNTRNDNNPYANNYYFVNSTDVNNGDLISSDSSRINQDVQNSAQSISGLKYTYVSMYILSYGLDDSNFTNIYSIPTFIGIFRLPEE